MNTDGEKIAQNLHEIFIKSAIIADFIVIFVALYYEYQHIMRKKNNLLFILLCLFVVPCAAQKSWPVPTPKQIGWHNAELGVVFHYDLHVFDGKRYEQNDNRINPIEDYNIFAPRHLDTDQWIRSAKAAGARFAVLTVTHETGFALYQSDVNPYCLKALRWRNGKGDLLAEFVASCRKYGIQPGIYVGIRWNSFLGIHNFRVEGGDAFAANRQLWYKHFCEKMVTELCTRYGPLFMIWFDGGADNPAGDGPDVLPIVQRYQPNCLFYHNVQHADFRWGGSESGIVDYPCWSSFPQPYSHHSQSDTEAAHLKRLKHGDPTGAFWVPAMADIPLRSAAGRHEWFWEPDDENAVLSVDALMARYEGSVGRNATLILGLTPNPDGLLPKGDSLRLQEFGTAIDALYGHPLCALSPTKDKMTGKRQLTLPLSAPTTVHAVILQEDIAFGERVRAYRLEARVAGHWQTVDEGTCIGHKHIIRFTPVIADKMRLTVTQSTLPPHIINFSVF
jgi:alpha-L-fucosidase